MTAASSDCPTGFRLFGLLRQDRQRCLQTVRQIPGFGERFPHPLIAMRKQRIQVVDKGLNFGGIRPANLLVVSAPNAGESSSEFVERRQPVSDQRHTEHQKREGGRKQRKHVVGIAERLPPEHHEDGPHVGDVQEAGRPQERAHQQAEAKRQPEGFHDSAIR